MEKLIESNEQKSNAQNDEPMEAPHEHPASQKLLNTQLWKLFRPKYMLTFRLCDGENLF